MHSGGLWEYGAVVIISVLGEETVIKGVPMHCEPCHCAQWCHVGGGGRGGALGRYLWNGWAFLVAYTCIWAACNF